jgi:hypothetical protein
MRRILIYFFLAFACKLFLACGAETASRKKPSWVRTPPEWKKEKMYFIGIGTSSSKEKAQRRAVTSGISQILNYLGISVAKDEKRFRIVATSKREIKINDLVRIASSEYKIKVKLADFWWQKSKDGNYEFWVLLETTKKEIDQALKENQRAKTKALAKLKEIKKMIDEGAIAKAIDSLETINPSLFDSSELKEEYSQVILTATQDVEIKAVKHKSSSVVFKVSYLRKPLAGVPVHCGENERTWTDENGEVECQKSVFSQVTVSLLPPFGPKATSRSPLTFALIQPEPAEPEYQAVLDAFRSEIEKSKTISVFVIPVSTDQKDEALSEAARKTEAELAIFLEVKIDKKVTFDPNDPAHYYYGPTGNPAAYDHTVTVELTLHLVTLDKFDEMLIKSFKAASKSKSEIEAAQKTTFEVAKKMYQALESFLKTKTN